MTSTELDEAKRKYLEVVTTLKGATNEELTFALLREFSQTAGLVAKPNPPDNPKKLCFWGPIILVLFVAGGSSAVLGFMGFSEKLSCIFQFEIKERIVFLGFVVALASYVASVGRELVKQQSAEFDEKLKKTTKLSIFLLVQVEIGLVFIGVSAVIFLFFGNFLKELATSGDGKAVYFNPDFFLTVYLSLILLWMSSLHARVWKITKPWEL